MENRTCSAIYSIYRDFLVSCCIRNVILHGKHIIKQLIIKRFDKIHNMLYYIA